MSTTRSLSTALNGKQLKKLILILLFFPVLLTGQHHASCPLSHHYTSVYENPLNEKWLSKYDVKFYHLSLEVSNMNTILKGFTTILAEVIGNLDTLVFELIDPMEISLIEVNNQTIPSFLHTDNVISIPYTAGAGEMISVTIHYEGDAGQNRGFFAGITSAYDQTNQQQVTYTLSEPLNARDWFPVKQVLSDKADSVWIDLICDNDLMAASNGLLQEIEDLGKGKHKFKWRSRYPVAYYLISLAVADYRDYSFYAPLSNQNDSVLVQNYIYDNDSYFATWKSRIDETGEMIRLFSGKVIDYPFKNEKYGHAVAPMGGGMEHQTMTTLANFNFNLVAHELAHQWFGNNVTCANWQDIWINEGFASYFEYIALQNLRTQKDADNWLAGAMSLALSESGSVYVPEEDAENVNRVFDYGLSYKKGAVLLHMIRYELNDDALFFKVLKTYAELYTDDVATAVDFREVLDSLSGLDFSCFFDQWYYGTGYPVFHIVWYRQNDTLTVKSLQETVNSSLPFFKTSFDIAVQTNEEVKIVRLFQEEQEQTFKIPMNEFVWDVQFDPAKHLLATGSVTLVLPDNKDFVMGPNPFRESILLKFRHIAANDQLSLFTLKGEEVFTTNIAANPYELNLSALDDGPYILVVRGEWGNFREKIVKVGRQ